MYEILCAPYHLTSANLGGGAGGEKWIFPPQQEEVSKRKLGWNSDLREKSPM